MQWACHLPDTRHEPCLVGIGNRLRGDDGAGPALCDRLVGRFGGEAIDAGVAPENHLERVATSPAELVLVVDAADFGGAPGEVRILSPDEMVSGGVSTHACSPGLLVDYLCARRDEPLTVVFVAVQPLDATGASLSPSVARGLDRLAESLCKRWPKQ